MTLRMKNVFLISIPSCFAFLLTACGTSIVNVKSNVDDEGSTDNQSIYGGQTPVEVTRKHPPKRKIIVRNKGL